jgi:hypothetical protein
VHADPEWVLTRAEKKVLEEALLASARACEADGDEYEIDPNVLATKLGISLQW